MSTASAGNVPVNDEMSSRSSSLKDHVEGLGTTMGQMAIEDRQQATDYPITTQFSHESFDIEKTLRLVSISHTSLSEGDDDSSPIECELNDFPLDQPPPFIYLENSLSFRHDGRHLRPITICGQLYLISQGLEVCMRRLRKGDIENGRPVPLYVLPICMDTQVLASLFAKSSRLHNFINSIKHAATAFIDALQIVGELSVQEIKHARTLSPRFPGAKPGLELTYSQALSQTRLFEPRPKRRTTRLTKKHNPLDRVANEIRLIWVLPCGGNADAPIEIEVKSVSLLDADTDFYALSYTWGGRDDMQTIYVDGQPILIQRNLYNFLKRNRDFEARAGYSFPLWIDALSINQEDPDEKSYEIQRMSEIYAAAEGVQVWLEDCDSQEYAISTSPMMSMRQITERSEDLGPESAHLMMKKHLYQAPDLYKDFAQLVLRPYFLRAWCTQELAYAKDVILMSENDMTAGWHSMSSFSPTMTDFETWLDLLKDEIPRDPYRYLLFGRGVHFSRFQLIHELQQRIATKNLPTLLSLLLATYQLESSDPRDKIYSLWSLAGDATKLLKSADYTRSTAAIFTDFTMAWIREYRSMDILAAGTIPQNGCEIGPPGRPSWVPDWSGKHISRPFISIFPSTAAHGCSLDNIEYSSPYRAAAGLKPVFSVVNYSAGMQGLLVNGISCDMIEFVGDMAVGGFAPPSSWHREVFSRFHEEGAATIDFELPQVRDFCNALHAGRMITGERAHEFFNAMSLFRRHAEAKDDGSEDSEIEKGYLAWRNFIMSIITGRRLVITRRGHVGLAPNFVEVGDEIAIVLGCSVPLVLQHKKGLPGRLLIGDCFFRRMMDGAMVDEAGGADYFEDLPFAKFFRKLVQAIPPGSHHMKIKKDDSSEHGEHSESESETSEPTPSENIPAGNSGTQASSDSKQLTNDAKKRAMSELQDVVAEAQKTQAFADKPTPTTFLLI